MAEIIGGLMLATVTIVFLLIIMQYFAVRYNYYRSQLSEEQQTSYLYIEDALLVREPGSSNSTLYLIVKGNGVIYEVYVNRSIIYINNTGLSVNGMIEMSIPLPFNVEVGDTIKILYDGGTAFGTVSNEVEKYVSP